jgi:hypothetical protein
MRERVKDKKTKRTRGNRGILKATNSSEFMGVRS